jgi:hypothetical protein
MRRRINATELTQMNIRNVRTAAPSFKSLAIRGLPRPRKGMFPTDSVIVAIDESGYRWEHNKLFRSCEMPGDFAAKVRAAGTINPQHWRKTVKEY